MKRKRPEPHFTASQIVHDIVIGMSDGLTVPSRRRQLALGNRDLRTHVRGGGLPVLAVFQADRQPLAVDPALGQLHYRPLARAAHAPGRIVQNAFPRLGVGADLNPAPNPVHATDAAQGDQLRPGLRHHRLRSAPAMAPQPPLPCYAAGCLTSLATRSEVRAPCPSQ